MLLSYLSLGWVPLFAELYFHAVVLGFAQAEDNEKFKTIVEFECRGLEPIDFQPQVTETDREFKVYIVPLLLISLTSDPPRIWGRWQWGSAPKFLL